MAQSSAHDQLMGKVVGFMRQHAFVDIRADHAFGISGISSPDTVGSYRPDATGLYQGRFYIIEAESSEGLLAAHTEGQLKAFLAEARRRNGWLVVAVSKDDKAAATSLLRHIGATPQDTALWEF